MLSLEQTELVRAQIANVLNVDLTRVVPEARLFGDLGGTQEHLKPLRLGIEHALNVQIEPVVNAVNSRTAVNSDGLLTEASMIQIADLLGRWPTFPSTLVSFPDLFTVSMVEAMVNRAAGGLPATTDEPPLELAENLKEVVYRAVAKICKVPVDQLHPDLEIQSPGEAFNFKFTQSLFAAEKALHVNLSVELAEYAAAFEAYSQGQATPQMLQKLRRLIPDLDTLPDAETDHTATVGMIERLCAAAIARNQASEQQLGPPAPHQEWWKQIPVQLETGKLRLYLTGMLRAAFVEQGTLDSQVNEALEVAENFAETGQNAELLEKKFRGVSTWKLGRNPLWGGLLNVLKPECTLEDCRVILAHLDQTFGWQQSQGLSAARAWYQSLVSPLNQPAEFDSKWVTEEVGALARQMHDNRVVVGFPKLGRLLEEAGCADPRILDHCRDAERRHLRGDWLIATILSASPVTPKKTSRNKAGTAKPKKVKFPTLSAKLKKKYKEEISSHNGGMPVASAWASSWQSDHLVDQSHTKRDHPNLTPDELKVVAGLYPARNNVLPEVAVARRIELQSAAELYTGLTLWVRMSLVIWHTRPYKIDYEKILQDGFAAGDFAALKWAVREFLYASEMDTEPDSWTYRALRAIATRDESRFPMLIDRFPLPAANQQVPSLMTGLRAILRRDASAIVAILNGILDEQRSSVEPEGFGVFSVAAHALHRAAWFLDPALVAEFDVSQSFPWDAEFYAVSTGNADPLKDFDFSNTPVLLRDLLLKQEVPQWLRDMPPPPKAHEVMGYVNITDIGARSAEVFTVLARGRRWTEDIVAHLTTKLPLTLHLPRSLSDRLVEELKAAGATVQLT